jgi:hypothetical protein
MKHRSGGHGNTSISGDTRADWSDAFALVPSLAVAYVWHASSFTREVLDGLLRIGFVHHQQIIWDKGRTVLTRTHYWFQHEPCWYVRKKNAPCVGWSNFSSSDPPMMNFGDGECQIVEFSPALPSHDGCRLDLSPILRQMVRG